MPSHTHSPDSQSPAGPTATTSADQHRRRHNRLIACGYSLGLLLTFILSLLLLPPDIGLGKLLRYSLSAFAG